MSVSVAMPPPAPSPMMVMPLIVSIVTAPGGWRQLLKIMVLLAGQLRRLRVILQPRGCSRTPRPVQQSVSVARISDAHTLVELIILLVVVVIEGRRLEIQVVVIVIDAVVVTAVAVQQAAVAGVGSGCGGCRGDGAGQAGTVGAGARRWVQRFDVLAGCQLGEQFMRWQRLLLLQQIVPKITAMLPVSAPLLMSLPPGRRIGRVGIVEIVVIVVIVIILEAAEAAGGADGWRGRR